MLLLQASNMVGGGSPWALVSQYVYVFLFVILARFVCFARHSFESQNLHSTNNAQLTGREFAQKNEKVPGNSYFLVPDCFLFRYSCAMLS